MNRVSPAAPLVVIGIPTYNRARLLSRAVDSALAQDYPNLALVIADNASTDDTQQVCERYAAADPRVTYFRHLENVGSIRNFADLLQRAKGEYFAWLADDDWLDPAYVGRCVQVLLERPDVVLAGGYARYYQGGVFRRIGEPTRCLSDGPMRRVLQYYRQVDDNAIFYGVMRRPAATRTGLLNCLGGDWLYVAAMAYQGKVETIESAFVHRDLGGASQSLRKMARALSLPAWQAWVPATLPLAMHAARDVGWRNTVYAALPRPTRLAFALLLFCWMCSIKPFQELRRRFHARGSVRMDENNIDNTRA